MKEELEALKKSDNHEAAFERIQKNCGFIFFLGKEKAAT